MKFIWFIALGIALSCGDDKRSRAKDSYELKVFDLADEFTQDTAVSVSVELQKDDELVTDVSTNVRMLVHCGGKRISTQELELEGGKASFTAFAVTAVGKCEVTLTSSKTKKKTINFNVKAKVTVQLPPTTQPPTPATQPPSPGAPSPPQPNKPTAPQPADKVLLPKLNASLTIGKPFSIGSDVARKVQPNSLCDSTIMLIYYDGSKVIEALTSGVHVPASNGKIEGLTFISLSSPPSIAKCGKGSSTKSITMSIMPGYPQMLPCPLVRLV